MRKLLLALAFITLNSTVSTQAETYPSRHITLVAPVAAGGPLDVNARLIATALGDVLGQQVIVENRTGAGTAVGTASVARAAPDGYTLLIADMTFVAGPSLVANLSYNPQHDFVPVAFLSRSNMLLVVNPTFSAKTVSDIVAMAKQKPGELQYAHAGLGTPPSRCARVHPGHGDYNVAHRLQRRGASGGRHRGGACSDDVPRSQHIGAASDFRKIPRSCSDWDGARADVSRSADLYGKWN